MQKIILPDIYGVTDALLELNETLQGDIEIVNPYSEIRLNFTSEDDAYGYFHENSSLDTYSQKLKQKLNEIQGPISMLGFSMGGSAIWTLADDQSLKDRADALCYYSGQVRQHTHITPVFPVAFVMAKEEPHFSVEELTATLATKQNTTVQASRYRHGFMNRHSNNFNPTGYKEHVTSLNQLMPEHNFTHRPLHKIEKP